MCSLIRSQKLVEKPPTSTKVLSTGLQKLRLKATQKRNTTVSFLDEHEDKNNAGKKSANKKKMTGKAEGSGGLIALFKNILKFFGNLLLNSRFSIDEVINICRPVIYIYSVIRFGRRSYRPLKISLLMDLAQIIFSCLRLWRSNREKRRLEMQDVAEGASHTRPKYQPLIHQVANGL